ncbi:mechanosensitive ion channel family protein [Pseudomonas sp. EA_35y_Pfl2_R5]|uniref:mechanosensitive ion channel family protein n=1 Tax=Pseudomonas sp. EA_35y_Pfl2_R5 TaxID=3088690 RepID=UPI0030D6FF92
MTSDWLAYIPTADLRALLAALLAAFLLALATKWLMVLLLRLTRSFTFARELLLQAKAPLRLLLPLLAVQMVWSASPDDILFIAAARHITSLGIIGSVTWLGLRAVNAIQQIILVHHPVNISDNLRARRIQTQTRVLVRTLSTLVIVFGFSTMLTTFPSARQFGTSLLASAGLAGLAVGFAAKPVLGNLIAGLQIALTQPIRLDDVVIVENEWGRIEEITGTYVVVRIWDDRRLIVPLQWFIENPFQNWTRMTSSLIGSVTLWVDYATPLEPLRREMARLCEEVPELWDGRVSVLQVIESSERGIQLRVLASSADSSRNWDLRCYLRENLINFISRNYPHCLPQLRGVLKPDVEKEHRAELPSEGEISEPERQPPV